MNRVRVRGSFEQAAVAGRRMATTSWAAGLPHAEWLASAAQRAVQTVMVHKRKIALATAAALLLRMSARRTKPNKGA